MNFVCEQCGEVDTILIDGYNFGDRLLEGVMFRVKYVRDKLTATIEPESVEYMKRLNKKKWIKECLDFIESADEFSGQCSVCGSEVCSDDEIY
jgi:hypothetical protein